MTARAAAALAEQLERRRAALNRGARHVGWKLGMGDRERIDGQIAVGHLTSETVLPAGSSFRPCEGAELHADAEAVVVLGSGAAIAGYAAALELVDLAPVAGEPDAVVAANVFHRAVAFAELRSPPHPGLAVQLVVNGRVRAAGSWPPDLDARIATAARLLEAVGERLGEGDRIITGSIVQVPVAPGDDVVAEFGGLASPGLQIGV